MVRRSRLPAVLLLGLVTVCAVSACTPNEPPQAVAPPTPTSTTEESAPETAPPPSVTREVPPEQRKRLAELAPDQLCALVSPDELSRLAFPVEAGKAREIGFDPPVRGCDFESRNGGRSVLIGAQPEGFATLGREEVQLGEVRGTRTMHAGECSVFAGVAGATLQVSVSSGESDTDQCEKAGQVARYVLPAVVA